MELDIGYATLKRLIDARLAAIQSDAMITRSPDHKDSQPDLIPQTVGTRRLH